MSIFLQNKTGIQKQRIGVYLIIPSKNKIKEIDKVLYA